MTGVYRLTSEKPNGSQVQMITPVLSNEPTMEFATFLGLDGMLVRRIVSLVPPSAKKNR